MDLIGFNKVTTTKSILFYKQYLFMQIEYLYLIRLSQMLQYLRKYTHPCNKG